MFLDVLYPHSVVEFKMEESMKKAAEVLNKHSLGGRPLKVKEDPDGEHARRAMQKVMAAAGGMGIGPGPGGPGMINIPPSILNNPNIPNEIIHALQAGRLGSTVFVANLDYKVGWKKLKEVFSMAGVVVRADILEDKDGKSRGIGTVTFEQAIEAVQAISMFNGQLLFDRPMHVKMDERAFPKGDFFPPERPQQLPHGLGGIGMGLGPGGQPIDANHLNKGMGMGNMGPGGMGMEGMGFGMNKMGGMEGPFGGMENIGRFPAGMNMGRMSEMDRAMGGGFEREFGRNEMGMSRSFGETLERGIGGGNASIPGIERMAPGIDRNFAGSLGGTGGPAAGVARKACQIFVRNLPFDFTWKMLKDKFNECGHVLYADIKMENGKSKGCGVVRFESPEVAERACRMMNGIQLRGREIDKCLISGMWLISRRYPVPAVHRGTVYRMSRPVLEIHQSRCYSSGGRKGFISGFVENIKQELAKNKEMKESIKKFRDEAKKLEESDALREARRKYKTIESETVKTSEVIKKKLEEITGTVKESLDEVSKSDIGRKIKEGVEEAAKTAKQSAESVTKGGEKLGKTAAFKAISQGVETVKKEIDESVLGQTGPYKRPERLRKRTEFSGERIKEERIFEANEEAMGVVLHKDSKWYQQWKDFKDNNVVFNRFFEMKMKYDESDNAFIRASRAVTDKVTDLIGGLFSKTEMSEVLTEILKVDPSFDKDRFLKQCEYDIIPNVLEAMMSGELDILKDWCYEATYSQLAHPIQQAKAMGLQFHSRILDIDNIDLAMGKMMEQGPVLIITFQAQVVMVIKNQKGEVVEGDPDKVLRMLYVWALCRDQDELNPYAAWRLLDISSSSTEQVL
uniref:Mitochondrial import inner membrane translocase subunit TIM44 n=2 Tax=Telluraves TaxID=3073808 RepID=A0A663FDL3_AQUCH